MNEDARYRTSSQYRLWSFTPERLQSLRANTNDYAIKQVRAAKKRLGQDGELDCLSPEEERIMVDFFCAQCLRIGLEAPFKFDVKVVGTAVQYLKRFYLSNSPMTYHPKQIFPAALFLATKTTDKHEFVKEYTEQLKMVPDLKKITSDEVLAPEFLIAQALRFSFDIRHPYDGFRGAYMEMLQLVGCVKGQSAPGWILKPGDQLRAELLRLPRPQQPGIKSIGSSVSSAPMLPVAFQKRVEQAYGSCRVVLRNNALLSDAYFLYTPSQIMLAAFYNADAPLTEYFLSLKLNAPISQSSSDSPYMNPQIRKAKVMAVIKECAALLREQAEKQPSQEVLRALDKKLYHCRNPDKVDLVGLNKAQKRDAGEEGKLDENLAKKRKLEREVNEKEANDLFGPALPRR